MDFKQFRDAIEQQFNKLTESNTLYRVNIDKDAIWNIYLDSFPDGTNEIYRERREYDCTACASFVKNIGNVVAIINDELVSVWDIEADDEFKVVADIMNATVTSKPIKSIFLHDVRVQLQPTTKEILKDGNIKIWEHFACKVPKKFKSTNTEMGGIIGQASTNKTVLKRTLEEINLDTINQTLDLCDSIYKGVEFKPAIEKLKILKVSYDMYEYNKDLFCWQHYNHPSNRIRNSAIGTLLLDLQEGTDIEVAVKKYETVVAPSNYKRTKAIVTPRMIEEAMKTIDELGIEESLERRFATIEDIPVTEVLYADRASAPLMKGSLKSKLLKDADVKVTPKTKNAIEISMKKFIKDILPKTTKLELLLENNKIGNMVSLIAPINENSSKLFKWDNPISWSYKGNITDSMKERVKAAGGRVDGVFRFTHSWNEIEPNQSLMDLHVFMPGCEIPKQFSGGPNITGRRVGWNNRKDNKSGGVQDVDYTKEAPKNYIPVENITFPNINKMPEGKYICKIHNWSYRNSAGKGKAEIEINGVIYKYIYPKTKHHEWVDIAEITLKNGKFSIKHILQPDNGIERIWNIDTNKYHKVTSIMLSPNYWGENKIGNKHYIFTLEDCVNDEPTRGIYNEFLREDLQSHRKVFDMIGNKFQCQPIDNSLNGVGFSETLDNSIFVKANNRPYKINIKG